MHSPEWLWLRSACRFWNALCAAPEGSLHKAVALSDWADAGRRRPSRNWAWSLQQHLSDLGYVFHLDHRCMIPIDVAAALTLLDAREQQCWDCDVCPRTCAPVGATYCKYLRWFALPDGAASNAFFRLPLGPSRVFQIVRFRLGCHKLPIVTRRNQGAPRAARLCLLCEQHALGDEYHMLFECPATAAARAPYAHLFPPGCTMLQFMQHPDTLAVARCILACMTALDA